MSARTIGCVSMRVRSGRISPLRSGITTLAFLFLLSLIAAELARNDRREMVGNFRVIDGDTVSLNGDRLRLKGIDAPEMDQTCRLDGENWACGKTAREALAQRLAGGQAQCTGERFDKYGRLLAVCSQDDEDLNAWMVRQGYAVAYGGYWREEAEARQAGKGLWKSSFERPENWRKEQQRGAKSNESRAIPFLCSNFGVFCAKTGGDENEAF